MDQDYKSITGLVAPVDPSEAQGLSTAENEVNPGLHYCTICSTLILGRIHVVNNRETCRKCAEDTIVKDPVKSRKAFLAGLLFGAAATFLGLFFCSLFGLMTKLDVDYLALIVGWLVGKGMMQGSNGVGGPRYQFAAAIYTYLAVSLAAVPVLVLPTIFLLPADFEWKSVVGKLALAGVASPFLELRRGFPGYVGLAVLFLGMRIASRVTTATWQIKAPQPEAEKALP